MQKRTSSQIYSSRLTGKDEGSSSELISNLAKSLREVENAGSQQSSAGGDSAEIKSLLTKISNQLESLEQNAQPKSQSWQGDNKRTQGKQGQQNQSYQSQQGQQSQQGGEDEQSGQPDDQAVTRQLQTLFQQLLQNNQSQNSGASNSSQNHSSKGQDSQSRLTAQTAAQALAQAQYELSTELEASLKKLKQVISESEKLANKISNLLGEENNSRGE